MFSFLAPLLVILSLAGIAAIVLRKTPEAKKAANKVLPKNFDSFADFFDVLTQRLRIGLKASWLGFVWFGNKLWGFVLGAKELSRKSGIGSIPRKITGTALQKARFNFRKTAGAGALVQTPEEQEREFLEAIKKNPKDETAYFGLGKLYLSGKKFEDARETFIFLTRKHPDNESYHFSLGVSYMGLLDFKNALKAYQTAVALKPDEGSQYINLGFAFAALGDSQGAIESFEAAVELEEGNIYFLNTLADAYEKEKMTRKAQGVLEKILVFEPTNQKIRERLMKLKF